MTDRPFDLPSPHDLGLPPKYESWRPTQSDGIEYVRTSDERVRGLMAPVGSGKTALALALGVLALRDNPRNRTLILTATKPLQAIYAGEGLQMARGMVANISGVDNYTCHALEPGERYDYMLGRFGKPSVAHAPCNMSLPCTLRDKGCTYYAPDGALPRARDASIVISNYANWLSNADAAEKEEKFGRFDWLICDEGHSAADAACDALAVDLDLRIIADCCKRPPSGDELGAWTAWARAALPDVDAAVGAQQAEVKRLKAGGVRVPGGVVEEFRRLQRAARSIRRVATAKGDWVMVREGNRVSFKPVWPSAYAESHLLRGIPNVVVMSGTLVPQDIRYLGIEQFDFLEMPSTFPPERRPVFIYPKARARWNMTEHEEQWLVDGLDDILASRPGWRHITHTVSYARTESTLDRSRHRSRMMTHERGSEATRVALKAFKEDSPEDAVFVSPAIHTGFDFPDDECRCQELMKIPFPDTRDLVTKARMQRDKKYLYYAAMKYIAQAHGRPVRSEEDYGELWVLDANALWFFEAAREFAPSSFPTPKKVSGVGRPPKL